MYKPAAVKEWFMSPAESARVLNNKELCSTSQLSNTTNRGAYVNYVEGYMCELFRIIQGSVLAFNNNFCSHTRAQVVGRLSFFIQKILGFMFIYIDICVYFIYIYNTYINMYTYINIHINTYI